jgi:hypothetical protein
MTRRFKTIIAALILTPSLFFVAAPIIFAASSNPLDQACSQGTAATSPTCTQAKTQGKTNPVSGPGGVINKAANIIALMAGIGAVIMILIGGFFYVTSAGNAENAAKAKSRILSALIGVAVVALAWAIVRLITDRIIR